MKKLSVVCLAIGVVLSSPAAFGRGGGMGSHSMSMNGSMTGSMSRSMTGGVLGGALGTSAATPGTNSLGTALPSSGRAEGPMKGAPLGESPAVDKEEAKVEKMIGSICRGC